MKGRVGCAVAQAFFDKTAKLGFLELFNIEHGDIWHLVSFKGQTYMRYI
jgi:hypothetical protein